ncbi:hypothetical protein BVY00_01335 [bacterium G20]|nr:hypothetical protein BVY00_01335 [bacterium G20]
MLGKLKIWKVLRGDPKNKRLPKISLFFFNRPKLSLAIWLAVVIFGVASYSTLLKREGFPSVNIPFTVVNGTYLVNDPAKIDEAIAKPLSEAVLKEPNVKRVSAESFGNFTTVIVEYKSGTDSVTATSNLEKQVRPNVKLPDQAVIKFDSPKFGFTERGDDMVVSFYSKDISKSTEQIAAKAKEAEAFLKKQDLSLVKDLSLIDPFVKGVDPATGQPAVSQKYFDRYGERQNSQNNFYPSVSIGLTTKKGSDIIETDKQVRAAVDKLNSEGEFNGYVGTLSASYAPDIKQQISELQRALLEGLVAALIVGSLVIALRASLITTIAMVSVISITLGLLYIFGYTLNTITLFALVLGLALIVDDTIIMIEAIDAQRRRTRNAAEAVEKATGKISRAMLAATSTAVLSFAPLLFVGGILGDFIRAIPVTVIIGLLTSFLVALIFIPTFARFFAAGQETDGRGECTRGSRRLGSQSCPFYRAPLALDQRFAASNLDGWCNCSYYWPGFYHGWRLAVFKSNV